MTGFNPRPASGAKGRSETLRRRNNAFQSAPRERGESHLHLTQPQLIRQFQSAPRERGESISQHEDPQVCRVSIRAPRAGRKTIQD